MKSIHVLLWFFLLTFVQITYGQNINFTQYFNYPIYSDPSQVGNGEYRLSAECALPSAMEKY